MTGSPPIGMFACDTGSLQELMADKTIACPCCNGPLTAEKLARLLADVQRLAAVGKDQPRSGSNGASRNQHTGIIIDPHAHMISRTTDDYEAMAKAGIVAVIEPAFWLGQPRTNVGSFIDYFSLISGFERFRAGQFGIRHYCTIGLNPKEANNEALAEAVIDALPRFLVKEGVVAMGELGYDEQTPLEDKALRAQIELAKEFELPIMIHTPHRDKRPGTLRTMDVLKEHGFDPTRCVFDLSQHQDGQRKNGCYRRKLWPRAFDSRFRVRLGRIGSACGGQDSPPHGPARRRRGSYSPGRLWKRARGLRLKHRNEGRALAGAVCHRSANAL